MLSSCSMTGAFNMAWEGVCLCILFAPKERRAHSKCKATDGWCDVGSSSQPTWGQCLHGKLESQQSSLSAFVNRETTAFVNPPPPLSSLRKSIFPSSLWWDRILNGNRCLQPHAWVQSLGGKLRDHRDFQAAWHQRRMGESSHASGGTSDCES